MKLVARDMKIVLVKTCEAGARDIEVVLMIAGEACGKIYGGSAGEAFGKIFRDSSDEGW